jgi:hypothetical protein
MAETPRTLEEAMDLCWSTARTIMIRKRRLRGHGNIGGLHEILIRVAKDKMARITRAVNDQNLRDEMTKKGVPQEIVDKYVPVLDVETESLEDDLLDCQNYFVIAWLLQKGWWALPLASELPEETGTRAGGMRVARGDLR